MVSCRTVAKNLSAYVDDDLDPKLRSKIEHHLIYCRRCSVLLKSVRKVVGIMGIEHTFELPIGFEQRLHAFIESHI